MVDMPDNSLPIPKYKHKENETIDIKKARLVQGKIDINY